MADGSSRPGPLPPSSSQSGEATGLHPRLGWIVGLDARGRALVEFPGSPPRPASTLGPVPRSELEQAAAERREVVLAFLDGRAEAPVLLSLHGPTIHPGEDEPQTEDTQEDEALELEIDGERELIEASRELVLRCGAASITLRSDGSVQIRGRDITSWARRRQRIRGGSVSIN